MRGRFGLQCKKQLSWVINKGWLYKKLFLVKLFLTCIVFWIRSAFSFWVPKLIVWIYKSVLVHKLHADLKSRWKTICKELYLSVQFIFSRTDIRWTFVPYFTYFFQLQDTSLSYLRNTCCNFFCPNNTFLSQRRIFALTISKKKCRLKIRENWSLNTQIYYNKFCNFNWTVILVGSLIFFL